MLVRVVVGAAVVILASTLVTGCSDKTITVEPTSSAQSASTGTATTTVQTAERSELEKIAAVQVCRNVITSAGAMVRDYNVFITKLNSVQSYAKMTSEDRWAADTLTTGADVVRKAISPSTPADLVAVVNKFVDSSADLAERIQAKQMGGLNAAATTWGTHRTAALDKCTEFLPTK
ncbi:hypothetical protein nbrc107696_38870 [Gordonia spumicola]|uniref:Lipoprotein n=1 Tax=Gordonia spumicola TaxID=589161 RepID=A0A7I9VE55_9ACTN|nr:hypothetical protein [Gordonia spumicola]GEE03441.1 hypothetical protein nbrc107696_38870 [Gordonia spumicola]